MSHLIVSGLLAMGAPLALSFVICLGVSLVRAGEDGLKATLAFMSVGWLLPFIVAWNECRGSRLLFIPAYLNLNFAAAFVVPELSVWSAAPWMAFWALVNGVAVAVIAAVSKVPCKIAFFNSPVHALEGAHPSATD